MTLRVVLYAEGAGERLGVESLLPVPGESLGEPHLGAAHHLLRRAIEAARSIPTAAIRFESPLRTRGRIATDLQHQRTLRQLLTWLDPRKRPDLAVVLVDCDGENTRKARLMGYVTGLPVAHVIAVAIQEFEAWLLADAVTVGRIAGASRAFAGPPEGLHPTLAKSELSAWLASTHDVRHARRQIASSCDLAIVAKACSSFATLMQELKA